jgi:hypothetical protein
VSLRELQKHLIEDLQEHLAVIASKAPTAQIGAEYDAAEECFHAVACCKLLASADRAGFQKHLFWAGLTRRYFLRRCKAEGTLDDFRAARSRSEGLFCAAAAGDVALAVEIGDLSPASFRKDGEYEVDFAHHLVVHRILAGADAAARSAALKALEKAAGGPSPRLDACRAIEARDADAFEAALAALAAAWQAERDELRERSGDVPSFEPLSRVFTEGLALIRAAERAGLQVPVRDYPLCPKNARVKPLATRPDDLFAEMAALPP